MQKKKKKLRKFYSDKEIKAFKNLLSDGYLFSKHAYRLRYGCNGIHVKVRKKHKIVLKIPSSIW